MQKPETGRHDPGGMFEAIAGLPRQLKEGRERAASVDPGAPIGDSRSVIVAGMGGSAIAGDLLAALAQPMSPVPILVSRSYVLPLFVDESTTVIASSYSGNTEETLAALEEAEDRGARIICIASGGVVAERARSAGWPLYELQGGMQPRAAIGYSFATLLTLAEQLGLLSIGAEAWEEALNLLTEQGEQFASEEENPTLDLAHQLRDRLPFVYAGTGFMAPVSTRWCCQLQENAKVLAHGNILPEMNHNEIVGWEEPAEIHSRVAVVALRDAMDHPRVVRRFDLTRAIVSEKAALWIDVESRGASDLARMLSLVQYGDWVSLYLALIRRVDPTPVRLIDRLKRGL